MSSRLGGFIAGQNINVSIGTFNAITSPTFIFTSQQATPAVGQAVQFTTTGTLPTGLSLNTTYYVISTSTNTCQFSTVMSGSAVTFTNSSGSGTHTAVTQRAFSPYAGAPDTVEYLVVAGGGGGGSLAFYNGGGGGAGGLLTASGFAVASGSALTVTVGAGGAGSTGGSSNGTQGSSSVFSSISTVGGGYGSATATGGSGGSGGAGGINAVQPPGAGTAGQGNNGGFGIDGGYFPAGGGGGSGSVGDMGAGGLTYQTVGGAGTCSMINGSQVFYAGGGGGGSGQDVIPQLTSPPVWGGGRGGNKYLANYSGTNAVANTGSGGGGTGSGGISTTYPAGSGGSGIVIIRYPQVNAAPAMVTGSPQVSYSDGYQIYTWTSSGSIIF